MGERSIVFSLLDRNLTSEVSYLLSIGCLLTDRIGFSSFSAGVNELKSGLQLVLDEDSVRACFSNGRQDRSIVLRLGRLFAKYIS